MDFEDETLTLLPPEPNLLTEKSTEFLLLRSLLKLLLVPRRNVENADLVLPPVFCRDLIGEVFLGSFEIILFNLSPILRVKLPPVDCSSTESCDDADEADPRETDLETLLLKGSIVSKV